jgi:hypothetical protein
LSQNRRIASAIPDLRRPFLRFCSGCTGAAFWRAMIAAPPRHNRGSPAFGVSIVHHL